MKIRNLVLIIACSAAVTTYAVRKIVPGVEETVRNKLWARLSGELTKNAALGISREAMDNILQKQVDNLIEQHKKIKEQGDANKLKELLKAYPELQELQTAK